MEESTLTLQMGFDRFAYLYPAYLLLIYETADLTGSNGNAICEGDRVCKAIDIRDGVSFILIQFAGVCIQVVSFRDVPGDFAKSVLSPDFNLERGGWSRGR